MKLTPEEKSDLKQLVNHRGFYILEKIYEEKRASLLGQFMSADLGLEKTRIDLSLTQNYIKGMGKLISDAKGGTKDKIDTVEKMR